MGPGREPEVCDNEELIEEFEFACRSGDFEFSEEYKKEIIRRLAQAKGIEQLNVENDNLKATIEGCKGVEDYYTIQCRLRECQSAKATQERELEHLRRRRAAENE